MITARWECFVNDCSLEILSFYDCSWFFEWSYGNIVLQDLRRSSLHSKEEEGSKLSIISKNYTGILFGFEFSCAGNWGRSGGGVFEGNWSGDCIDGWFCGWGITPIDWLIGLVGHVQLWDHISTLVGWFVHSGGYKLFDVFFHEVVEYYWFGQEGLRNEWFFHGGKLYGCGY